MGKTRLLQSWGSDRFRSFVTERPGEPISEVNMRNVKWILASVFLSLLSVSQAQVERQDEQEELSGSQEADIPTVTLSVGDTSGRIGEEIAVPIEVTATISLKEPFKIVLRFPPSKLEYTKLGVGSLPKQAGWKLKSELKTTPIAFDMYFVEISVEPGEGDLFPPGGLVAFAYFNIVTTTPDHPIELSPSLKLPDGASLVRVKTEPAEIMVYPEALIGCLFYMH